MKSLSNGRENSNWNKKKTGHFERAPLDHRITGLDRYESSAAVFAVTTRPAQASQTPALR